MTPAKTMTAFMLVVYVCVAVYLFANLKKLDLSLFSGVRTESGNNARSGDKGNKTVSKGAEAKAQEIAYRKVSDLLRETEPREGHNPRVQEPLHNTLVAPTRVFSEVIDEMMKQDGRLCCAQVVQPYFARR